MNRPIVQAAIFGALLGLTGVQGAYARRATTGTVKLEISEATSMTDLQKLLEKRGYTDVRLSPVRPNEENPRPDVQGTSGAAKNKVNPNVTPIHNGWNGTAVRDGKRVNIVIDDKGLMTEH